MKNLLQLTALVLALTVGGRALPPGTERATPEATVDTAGSVTTSEKLTLDTAGSEARFAAAGGGEIDADRHPAPRPRGGRPRPRPLVRWSNGSAPTALLARGTPGQQPAAPYGRPAASRVASGIPIRDAAP